MPCSLPSKNLCGFPACALHALLALSLLSACSKEQDHTQLALLQHKWTLAQRQGVFPDRPSLNFTEAGQPGDYLIFGQGDSVYSYIAAYLPFSVDTASYRLSGHAIFFHDTREYGIVFRHQVGNGVMVDTTTAGIVSLSSSFLQLRFPVETTIDDNGDVT
jgi:hypothetical protein